MTVTGLILAGGRAKRMGGQDKGLITLDNRSLIEHTLFRFSPQVDRLFIGANRNIDRYSQFEYVVLEDTLRVFEGPLAGLQRLFEFMSEPMSKPLSKLMPKEMSPSPVVLAPCDAPLLSHQLVVKLLDSYNDEKHLAVIPHDGDRIQPLFGLYSPRTFDSLNEYLESGHRKVLTWVETLSPQIVDFSNQAESFLNVNTFGDLKKAKERLANDESHKI